MSQPSRLTIYADDLEDTPSPDVLWVRAWLERWKSKVHVVDYSTGGWEHLWFVEGPSEAIAEVPVRLHCCSEWSNPEIFGDQAAPDEKKA
jgi:hypothetical protein